MSPAETAAYVVEHGLRGTDLADELLAHAVARWVERRCSDNEIAGSVMERFESALRSGSFELTPDGSGFTSWLTRCERYATIDTLRKQRRVIDRWVTHAEPHTFDKMADDADVCLAADRADEQHQTHRALRARAHLVEYLNLAEHRRPGDPPDRFELTPATQGRLREAIKLAKQHNPADYSAAMLHSGLIGSHAATARAMYPFLVDLPGWAQRAVHVCIAQWTWEENIRVWQLLCYHDMIDRASRTYPDHVRVNQRS